MLLSPNRSRKFEGHDERRAQLCPTFFLNARLPMAPSLPLKKARHAPPWQLDEKLHYMRVVWKGYPGNWLARTCRDIRFPASMTGIAEIKHA